MTEINQKLTFFTIDIFCCYLQQKDFRDPSNTNQQKKLFITPGDVEVNSKREIHHKTKTNKLCVTCVLNYLIFVYAYSNYFIIS